MSFSRSRNEIMTIWSILLGVFGFSFSIIFLKSGINPTDGSLNIQMSNSTFYKKNITGLSDTLFLGTKEKLNSYIDAVKEDGTVKIVNESNYIPADSLFSKKSIFIKDLIFVSKDSLSLNNKIDSLDNNYYLLRAQKNYFINQNPKAIVWVLLISIAIGFSLFFVPIFIAGIIKYSKGLNRTTIFWNIFISLGIILTLVLSQVITEAPEYKILIRPVDVEPNFDVGFKKNQLLYGAILPYLGPAFWMILIISLNSKISFLHKNDLKQLTKRFNEFRKEFEYNFVIIAIFIAYTIYCTSTLLNALNSLINPEATFQLFPVEFSFINGLSQTFFLALIYLAINTNFIFLKSKIQEVSSEEVISKNSLDKNKSFLDYLKIVISILAPLIGGGIQELFNTIIS